MNAEFHRVRGSLDAIEAMDALGGWWTVDRRGSQWTIAGPAGVVVQTEPSKTRAIDACRLAMSRPVEDPAPAPASAPRPASRPRVSVAELLHRKRVRALGCVVADEHCAGPVEYAHVKPRQDGRGIGLCAAHHRESNVPGVAFHKGQRSFEDRYAPEVDLLEIVTERLAEAEAMADRMMAEASS